jgi:hypothetical protein
MQTFRRLNDPERYYGLSWRGWLFVALGGAVVYLAVRFSPLGMRPTITITVLTLALAAVILHAVSGQALGPGRYLLALYRYTRERKQLELLERPEKSNLILDQAPELDQPAEPVIPLDLGDLDGVPLR